MHTDKWVVVSQNAASFWQVLVIFEARDSKLTEFIMSFFYIQNIGKNIHAFIAIRVKKLQFLKEVEGMIVVGYVVK